MKARFVVGLGLTGFAAALSLCFYGAWGAMASAPVPFIVVGASAAMIGVGIAIGDYLRDALPGTRWWLVPNLLSLILSVPLAMPYPFDPGMPLCMVSTAVICGRLHPLVLNRSLIGARVASRS